MMLGTAVLSIFGWCPLAWCQTERAGSADNAAANREFQFTVHYTSESGVRTYVPEKWSALSISLLNGRSEPRDLVCSTYFEEDVGLQYGRRVWLPARSILRTEYPALIPRCDPSQGRKLSLHSIVLDRSSSREALIRSDSGVLRHDGALIVTHDSRNTAIIDKVSLGADALPVDPMQIEIAEPPNEVADLVAACRVELSMGNSLTLLGDAFLAPDEIGLDALDQIVVADDRILNDLAATAALRRWLNAGGNLWIMLDRVRPVVLEMLLGDDFTGYVVDRVRLTSVRVDSAPVPSNPAGKIGETAEFDDPVDLVRMAVAGVNVTHLVNGWPAAISIPCGDGKLLITTLGARGWMRPRPDSAEESNDPLQRSSYRPTAPMADVADDFFRGREPELLPSAAMEPQVREYVGYSVPSWWLIVGTLSGFSVCLVAIGVWLLRCGHLEQVWWVGSILAFAVSLVLIEAGRMNRQGIPATMASVQLTSAIRGTDDLISDGLLCIYHPEGSEFEVAATRGGRMTPDMTGLEQTSRRLLTTDLDAYHWENLRQPAGVRSTPFRNSETVMDRPQAHATFDREGLSGRYSGLVPPGTDAMVATRNGRLGVTLRSDGEFVGRAGDVFETDRYLAAGLLSDEQDRRRRTLQALLGNPRRPDYPGLPQLMFWSGPRDNGFRFGGELREEGASLIAVPLILVRPPNGTEITIPAPLLSYVNRRSPDGTQASAMWNDLKKQWEERSAPGSAWLSVDIPHELLPVTVHALHMDLKVSGPIGRVQFLGLKEGSAVSLKTITNPVGSLSIEITDADALTVDDEGRLALGLIAGESDRPDLPRTVPGTAPPEAPRPVTPAVDQTARVNFWRIESLALQLRAKTTEPAEKE
jgi:hypothetical protein